mgnify:CR=1 FL=1
MTSDAALAVVPTCSLHACTPHPTFRLSTSHNATIHVPLNHCSLQASWRLSSIAPSATERAQWAAPWTGKPTQVCVCRQRVYMQGHQGNLDEDSPMLTFLQNFKASRLQERQRGLGVCVCVCGGGGTRLQQPLAPAIICGHVVLAGLSQAALSCIAFGQEDAQCYAARLGLWCMMTLLGVKGLPVCAPSSASTTNN